MRSKNAERIQHTFNTQTGESKMNRIYFMLATMLTTTPSKGSGEGGIRTRGGVSPTQHFQCCTFGRSVTSPCAIRSLLAFILSTFSGPPMYGSRGLQMGSGAITDL